MGLLLNFLLLIATIPLCYLVSGSQAATNGTDHLALLSFKDLITDDPLGVLKSWVNPSVSYCQWHGVTCGARGQRCGRVTALELPRLNLSGIISPKIANLTFLMRLDLSKNQLHGTVPHELSLLHNLNHLDLRYNTLHGKILPSLSNCSSLRNISLGFNNLQEYGIGNEVSTYGDAFSYGILLLELFAARRPTDSAFKEGISLHQYIEKALPNKTTEVIDQSLLLTEHNGACKPDKNKSEIDIACITSVLTVGIQCSEEEPTERMPITDALREMHRIREKLHRSY